jgi:hypothetical protein
MVICYKKQASKQLNYMYIIKNALYKSAFKVMRNDYNQFFNNFKTDPNFSFKSVRGIILSKNPCSNTNSAV